jgi:hypothetical protein
MGWATFWAILLQTFLVTLSKSDFFAALRLANFSFRCCILKDPTFCTLYIISIFN